MPISTSPRSPLSRPSTSFPWQPERPSPLRSSMVATDELDSPRGTPSPSSSPSLTPQASNSPVTPSPLDSPTSRAGSPTAARPEWLRSTASLRMQPRYAGQMAWSAIRRDFADSFGQPCSVRVADTDRRTWQQLLMALQHSSFESQFLRRPFGLVRDVGEMRDWLARDGWPFHVGRARIVVSLLPQLQVTCRPRHEGQMEFEFDSRGVGTERGFVALSMFAEFVCSATDRPVTIEDPRGPLYGVAGPHDPRLQWCERVD